MPETTTPPVTPPDVPGPEALANPPALAETSPPAGWPEGAPWPPPGMPGLPGPAIRDSGFVDSGVVDSVAPESSSSSSPTPSSSVIGPFVDSGIREPSGPDTGTPATLNPQAAPLPGSGLGTADSAPPTQDPQPTTENPPSAAPGVIHEVAPASLPIHPYANLLPLMSATEYRRLKDAIALDGQQVPAQVFAGQLLDGRNRARACQELGIPLKVEEFVGTDQTALVYVLSVNQNRRELSKSQRAKVAVELLPLISEDVNRKRIERLRETLRLKQTGESMLLVADTPDDATGTVLARSLAADLMGVSGAYVQMAIQLKRLNHDMFEQVGAGKISLKAALRQAEGSATDGLSPAARALRQRVTALLRDPARGQDFGARLGEFLKGFGDQ